MYPVREPSCIVGFSTPDELGAAPIRVLIVDDHEVFGSSLAVVLNGERDMRTVGVAKTVAEALRLASANAPDVILLDNRLPDGDGVGVIRALVDLPGAPQVVVLTATTSELVMLAAMEAGAAGFLDKSRSLAEVVGSVRAAAAGDLVMSPQVLSRLLARLRRSATAVGSDLTEREAEVLQLLAKGGSNADIARELTLSVHTIRNHVANLSAKLGAHSKLEALAIAVREGLIGDD